MKGRSGRRIPKDVLVLARSVAEGGTSPASRRVEGPVKQVAAATAKNGPAASGTKTKIVNVLRKLHPMA